jgi:hypothetical protein
MYGLFLPTVIGSTQRKREKEWEAGACMENVPMRHKRKGLFLGMKTAKTLER